MAQQRLHGPGFWLRALGSGSSGSPTPRQEQEHPPASPLTHPQDGSTSEARHAATNSSRLAVDRLEW